MTTIIQKSIANSFSYQDYRAHIKALAAQGKSTGMTQTEALLHYSQLNITRMNRLDKTIKITEEVQEKLKKIDKEQIWLVLSESWCGDAAQILPVINKMAEHTNKVDFRVVLRDETDDLMHLFLTNGTRSIPKLILLDKETLTVLGTFGPRPLGALQLITQYKNQHGLIDETAKIELQKWYLSDQGLSIQNEILHLIQS